MLDTPVADVNSTSVPFSIWLCFNGVHVGVTVVHVVESLCFILGTPAHCWLLWLYLHADCKIKPTQVFPLNLTILELISFILCAVEVSNMLIYNSGAVWIMIFTVFTLSYVSRPLMQVCICVEQYLAVIHPVMFLKYNAIQYRTAIAALVWLMAAAFAVYEMFADNFPDPMLNMFFFISVIIILFCCVSVLRALKHPGPGDSQTPVKRGRDVGNQQKRKAFNTIFTGLLIILFSYLPQISLSVFIVIPIDEELLICNIAPIMSSFNILGVMITPLMKIYKNVDRKCFKCLKGINENA